MSIIITDNKYEVVKNGKILKTTDSLIEAVVFKIIEEAN